MANGGGVTIGRSTHFVGNVAVDRKGGGENLPHYSEDLSDALLAM